MVRIHMQTMVNRIKDNQGKNNGFVAISRDITKEHEENNRLSLQQQKPRPSLSAKLANQKQKNQFNLSWKMLLY